MINEHDAYQEEMALRDIIATWEPNPMHNISRAERFRRFHDRPITTPNQPGNAGTTVPRPKSSQASGRQERRAARASSAPASARPSAILRTIAKARAARPTTMKIDPQYSVAYVGLVPHPPDHLPPQADSPWSSTPSSHGASSTLRSDYRTNI